jgi:RHS repeat-associated protein
MIKDRNSYFTTANASTVKQATGVTDDGSFLNSEYHYVANGNLITDLNKSLSISKYNHLNLPEQLNLNPPQHYYEISYLYSAAGQKLRKATHIDYTPATTTDYCGSFIYEDDVLQTILTAEGRVVVDGSTYEYQYFLKDHLGNTRITFNESGNVIQEDSYYPFGMNMAGLSHSSGEDLPNKYLYNGKELHNDFGLGWYDYGARFYDPTGVHWTTVDPMAEKYSSFSPYHYAYNNPLLFIDPNGEEIWIYYNDDDGKKQKMQYTAGMKYEGDNKFVSTSIGNLNKMNSIGAGGELLGKLIDSKNSFDFTNTYAKDKKGNDIKGTLSFNENEDGGGIINAASLMENGLAESTKLESTAHELFHGYQHEQGQGGASIMNEVEANIFGYGTALEYSLNNGSFASSSTPLGRNNAIGTSYQKSFNSLLKNFSVSEFKNAVLKFKSGSISNSSGIYNNYPLQRSNQTKSMINRFYPIVKQ